MASHLLALVSPRSPGRQRARGSRRFPAVAFVGALLIGVLAPAAQAGADLGAADQIRIPPLCFDLPALPLFNLCL